MSAGASRAAPLGQARNTLGRCVKPGSLIQISALSPHAPHGLWMERIELLRTRIALYRRYLSEGADGDMARAYLWLIRQDEIELIALVEREKNAERSGAAKTTGGILPMARQGAPKDG